MDHNSKNNIFVDTNVFVSANSQISNSQENRLALKYIESLRGKRLYTSSLCIAQLVSVFQRKKTNEQIKKIVRNILAKYTIIDCKRDNIEEAIKMKSADIEDCIQYSMGTKLKCGVFVTNNKKDYVEFVNIDIIKPKKIRSINQ